MTQGFLPIQPRHFYRTIQTPLHVPGWAEPPEPWLCITATAWKMLQEKQVLGVDYGSFAERCQGEDGAGRVLPRGCEKRSLKSRLCTSKTAQRNLRSWRAQDQTSTPAAAKGQEAQSTAGARWLMQVGQAGFQCCHREAVFGFTLWLFLLTPFPAGPAVASQNKQLP